MRRFLSLINWLEQEKFSGKTMVRTVNFSRGPKIPFEVLQIVSLGKLVGHKMKDTMTRKDPYKTVKGTYFRGPFVDRSRGRE